MEFKKKDFIESLEDLCYVYRDYIKEHDNSILDIVIHYHIIKMVLYNNGDVKDSFEFVFNQKEDDSYRYISVCLLHSLFGSKVVFTKDNIFYNKNNNIKFTVTDDKLYILMINMLDIYGEIDFYDRIENGKRIRRKINRVRSVSFLDDRVELTKKLLKVRTK